MGKHYKEIIWQIMKIGIVPCLLWKFCMQLLLAKDLRAQEILSKRIFIHVIMAGWIDIKLTGSQRSAVRQPPMPS